MKLLFVTHWANNMLIFRTWMLQEAVRRGHEVLVLCPEDPQMERLASLGVRPIAWKLRRGAGLFNLWASIRHAKHVLQSEQPQVTVVYCMQPLLAILCAWKWGPRIPGKLFAVLTGLGSLWTDMEPPSFKKRWVRGVVERVLGALLPLARMVFVLNQDDKTQVATWNPQKLEPISGVLESLSLSSLLGTGRTPVVQTLGEGIDLQWFTPPTPAQRLQARQRWGIPEKARVVGFVGRLIREKGAQDFLHLSQGLAKDSHTHFLVVGDPDSGNPSSLSAQEMEALQQLPRLHWEPWMEDVRPAYAAMDVLLFLSRREGLPVVPQEAMAMEVPVVALLNVGTRELPVIPLDQWDPNGPLPPKPRASLAERGFVQSQFLDAITGGSHEV